MTGDDINFQTVFFLFADFEQFKIESHSDYFGQVEIDPCQLWAGHSFIFTEIGQDVRLQKTIQTLSV